ncbi:MAG: hypothetical protein IKM02_04020, partial [Clostridia bacterium]|nr:hypothetical protein [Clostridia bacterium]
MPYRVGKDIKTDLSDLILRSGETARFEFSGDGLNPSDHHRLYFTCEDRMHYFFKDEPAGHRMYMLIEDSLDTEMAQYDRYCLDMSEDTPRPFPKRAAKKCVWPPLEGIYELKGYGNVWRLGVYTRAEGLAIGEGGWLRLRFERWNRRQGVSNHEIGTAPDEVILIDIAPGSYGYTAFEKQIHIDDDRTACVLVTLEGLNYSGRVYFERPYLLADNGSNLLPAFDIALPTSEELYRGHAWIGQSLSKKEWPRFRMTLNSKVFFEGETFLRIHRYAPVEIPIPQGLIGESNALEITYISDYHDTVPLALREVKILEKKKAPFHIHACPETAVMGRDIPVLIETEADGLTLDFSGGGLQVKSALHFPEKGLHVIRLAAERP